MSAKKTAPEKKTCSLCKKTLPIREFPLRIAGISGELSSHYKSQCRPCDHEKTKKSYYKHRSTEWLSALEAKTLRNLRQIRAELARRI